MEMEMQAIQKIDGEKKRKKNSCKIQLKFELWAIDALITHSEYIYICVFPLENILSYFVEVTHDSSCCLLCLFSWFFRFIYIYNCIKFHSVQIALQFMISFGKSVRISTLYWIWADFLIDSIVDVYVSVFLYSTANWVDWNWWHIEWCRFDILFYQWFCFYFLLSFFFLAV